MFQRLFFTFFGRKLKDLETDSALVDPPLEQTPVWSKTDKFVARAEEMLAAGVDEAEIPSKLFDEAVEELKANPPFATCDPFDGFRAVPLKAGYPEGDWVQKIGFFSVSEITADQRNAALEFAVSVENANASNYSYGISVGENGEVYGHAPNLSFNCVGVLPREVLEVEKSMPPAMRRAYWLRELRIGDDRAVLIAGLLQPPVRERRAFGFEETPIKSPSRLELTEGEVTKIVVLIEWLENMIPLSLAEANSLSEAHGDKNRAVIMDITFEEDTQVPLEQRIADARKRYGLDEIAKMEQMAYGHLTQDHETHVANMREMKDDIRHHCQITKSCMELWFKIGMYPAPHYPRRIAIILGKARRRDLEARFLRAWIRHFPENNTGIFSTRLKKAEKTKNLLL